MPPEQAVVDWLLDNDPALRWQVERDIVGAPEQVWTATRARVATEGFGARLLALQGADGQWAGGAYFPRAVVASGETPEPEPDAEAGGDGDAGQPWTATTWSLNPLREWGLDAAALSGTADKLAANSRWEYEDLPYWGGEVDCCINGYTLANGAWLGADVSALAQWFPDHQLADGGNDAVRIARHAAEAYLLDRRLLRSRSTGELVGPWVTELAYPFRWVYSALNALDYFRAAALADGVPPDPRLAEAVEVVRAARQVDGTWLQGSRHAGRVWFEVDVPPGEASPWLTCYATRVLAWWDGSVRL